VGNAVFDPLVTRGFDYYTGMVFEFFDRSPENPRSLFGGGRYDGLVALFGGDPIPAVGFALGDVTLADFLGTHGLAPAATDASPQLYLATPSAGDIPAAQAFAKTLREKGCRIFVNLSDKGLGDQVKDAVRRGIPYFAAFGAREAASDTVKLKNLAASAETEVSRADLPSRVRS
jgi:histidyl-tRNA synthetase